VTRKFAVYMGWGADPENTQETEAYWFDTEAERDAFVYGTLEAAGWGAFEVFDSPQTYRKLDGAWVPDGGEHVGES